MRKIKIAHIGLLCGALCFVAGAIFTADNIKNALFVGGALFLLYAPLYRYLQKTEGLRANNPVAVPGIKEYGIIVLVVAILVAVVFYYTDGLLKSAISASFEVPST